MQYLLKLNNNNSLGIAFLQIDYFPFSIPWRERREEIPRIFGIFWRLVLNTRSPVYPEPRRHGLLERPIIKVMATFQVDFRVARSKRPPPGRPITVTKGLAILFSDPFSSSLYLLCTPNGNSFLSSNCSVHPPSIIVYTHR